MTEVVIDGAIPRTPLERCRRLVDFCPPPGRPAQVDGLLAEAEREGAAEFIHEIEADLIEAINGVLADERKVLLAGGFASGLGGDPGDVLLADLNEHGEPVDDDGEVIV